MKKIKDMSGKKQIAIATGITLAAGAATFKLFKYLATPRG
jgi:hypothetical protein